MTDTIELPRVAPRPGETCSCGAKAYVVYLTERFGRVGWCGQPDDPHDIREPSILCATYSLAANQGDGPAAVAVLGESLGVQINNLAALLAATDDAGTAREIVDKAGHLIDRLEAVRRDALSASVGRAVDDIERHARKATDTKEE